MTEFNIDKAIVQLHAGAAEVRAEGFVYGKHKCALYVKKAIKAGGINLFYANIKPACQYGPTLVENDFAEKTEEDFKKEGYVYQKGDVVIIKPYSDQSPPYGHMEMFDGVRWVSDFVQPINVHKDDPEGFYPGPGYRKDRPQAWVYRHGGYGDSDNQPVDEAPESEPEDKSYLPDICYPIPADSSGREFSNLDEILDHLNGENTGLYLIGRNCMWHGGIHITNVTTPWCALSGNALSEAVDFPRSYPYSGEQFVHCMADGEVVAYRVCRDYLEAPWEGKTLSFSGSFLLVRHHIQPGQTEKSQLQFYTMYMHLAPWSAYEKNREENLWITQDNLPAYKPEWSLVVDAGNQVNNKKYRVGTLPTGAIIEWDGTSSKIYNKRSYGLVTFKGLSDEMKKQNSQCTLKEGEQYWTLVDNDPSNGKANIIPWLGRRPSWWAHFVPPVEPMKFNTVICPVPFPIKAGASVGHLGYYQAAKEDILKEGEYEAYYQVHIECLSTDKNLAEFLKNPERVGKDKDDKPVYLKYKAGEVLYCKDSKNKFSLTQNKTKADGILTIVKSTSEEEKYYNITLENGWILAEPGSPGLLSQYDLEQLGFTIIEDSPKNFDHLDGKTPPDGLVRGILVYLWMQAVHDLSFSHALEAYNYQRLVETIDAGRKYSPTEYLLAIHNEIYHKDKCKIIAKHPSEWYFKSNDPIWLSYLDKLLPDALNWKSYDEIVIDKLSWMQDVKIKDDNSTIGPSLWHMHPLVFLGQFKKERGYIIKYTKYSTTLQSSLDKQMRLGVPNWKYGPQIDVPGHGWTPVSRDTAFSYLNPKLYSVEDNDGFFQFNILTSYIGIPLSVLEKSLVKKGTLAGKAESFLFAAKKYNINEMYLIAHAITETGGGTSKLATGRLERNGRGVYNMYGIAAFDGAAESKGADFAGDHGWYTPEDAIIGGAEFTSKKFFQVGQDTLYKMRWNPHAPATHQYATAVNWALVQSQIMYKMAISCPDFVYYFDIPVYNGEQ